MATPRPGPDWRDWLRRNDAAAADVVDRYISGTHEAGPLSARERQIVLMAAALSRQIRTSVSAHAAGARAAGATLPELTHVVMLTALSAGMPCAVLGLSVLAELAAETEA